MAGRNPPTKNLYLESSSDVHLNPIDDFNRPPNAHKPDPYELKKRDYKILKTYNIMGLIDNRVKAQLGKHARASEQRLGRFENKLGKKL